MAYRSKIRKEREYKGQRGQRIYDLCRLHAVALQRRSVLIQKMDNHVWVVPAAFIISQQARVVLRHFEAGMWVYEKPESRRGN